jgi:hypothetical protein
MHARAFVCTPFCWIIVLPYQRLCHSCCLQVSWGYHVIENVMGSLRHYFQMSRFRHRHQQRSWQAQIWLRPHKHPAALPMFYRGDKMRMLTHAYVT